MCKLARVCLVLMASLCSLALYGQNAGVISWQAIDQNGQPVPFAQVRVCSVTSTGTPCVPTTPIYQDYNLTVPAANPYSADQYGNFSFYVPVLAAPNIYEVQLYPASGVTWSYLFNGPITVYVSCSTQFAVQFSDGGHGFSCDPTIVINPTIHRLSTPQFGLTSGGNSFTQIAAPGTTNWGITWPTAPPTGIGQCFTADTNGVASWSPSCGLSNNPGFGEGLINPIGPTDTTFAISGSHSISTPGYLYIDAEWINYTSISGGTVTVATNGRGYFGTTAASHTPGGNSPVVGCAVCISFPTIKPFSPVVGDAGAGTQIMGINNPFPTNDEYSGQIGLAVNTGGTAFLVDRGGAVHQIASTVPVRIIRGYQSSAYPLGSEFGAPIYVGAQSTAPIVDSSYIVNSNVSNQITQPQGLSGGVAGPFTTLQPPTTGPPLVTPVFNAGSTTWSYVCQGVDSDGNVFPGTTGTTTTGAASLSFPGNMEVLCPPTAGAVSFKVYRTAGGPNIGLLATVAPPHGNANDFGSTLDGTSPSGSNGDIPRLCNNNYQYCLLSGTSGTPPIACGSGQAGWEYHIVGATSSPFTLRCVSGAWVNAQGTTTGATGTFATPSSITVANGLTTSVIPGPVVLQTEVLIITSGICSTTNSASATCTMSPVNWPQPFVDSNYSATCTPSAPSAGIQANIYVTKTASSVTIKLQNGQGSAAMITTVPEIDCYGTHP